MQASIENGTAGLHDAMILRKMYLETPQKIVQALSVPHQKIDHLYLTKRARGQLSGVESTITSLLRYDTARKNDSNSKTNIYSSIGGTDIASQLGVQPYTILPSPTNVSYESSLGNSYSGSTLGFKKTELEYLV